MNRVCDRCHNEVIFGWDYPYACCPPCLVEAKILSSLTTGESVLDVGAGLGRYHHALYTKTDGNLVLLDAHMPNVIAHNPPPGSIVFVGDALLILPAIKDNAFDVVIAIDVIEHLVKEDALTLIAHMQRIAERGVLLFTPEGFMPQEKDHYNLGGDHWQTHRSGWTPAELAGLGFRVETWPAFHSPTIGALFALSI